MNKACRLLFAATLFLCSASAWGQDGHGVRVLRGRVVDAEGKPVAGVLVGGQIGMDDDATDPAAEAKLKMTSVKSDAEGKFSIERTFHGMPTELVARHEATQRGGYAIVDPKNADKPVEIKIGKLVRLHGLINCKDDPNRKVEQTFAILMIGNGPARYGYFQSNHARFDMLVPPGDYTMLVGGEGPDYDMITGLVTINDNQDDLDQRTISIPLKGIVKLKGKPAPKLSIVDARGAPKTVQVADYKGKWVLIYFWGFW